MDGPGHLLSLKVMRVSRPALATAWEPFYSSSPSFSAHSTESILSLQGNTPLPGHPKTLRDLTNVSELLTLPASFGAIQLGETFSGVLAVNNETAATVDGVLLRVEMQTASNKISLLELGGELQSLAAGDTLEAAVSHEIKELGQHVLACTVTYKLPPGSRQPKSESNNPDVQLFRKFYKFTVSNPLSVKTKVHVPKSPAGMLSRQEREKVFLEVHIQNMTPEPMSFERILLDPAPGWNVEDINTSPGSAATEKETLFSGSMAMMLPQDARQYLYILTPTQPSEFLVQPTPGSVIPLGRLDLSWRSSFGEPGRLLTSMLSRRIPLVAPTQVSAPRQQPASALPPHIQRSQSAAAQPPSRPGSPQISTPTTPVPYRPASPRVKTNSIASITSTLVQAPPATPQSHALPPEPLDIDLVVTNAPREPVPVEIPLLMKFSIGLSATVPEGRRRTVSLAIQHVELPRPALRASRPAKGVPGTASQLPSPRLTHGGPGSMSSVQLGLAVSAPSQFVDNPAVLTDSPRVAHAELASDASKQLPRPVPMPGDEEKYASLSSARYLGSSVRFLPPFTLEAGREPVFSEFEATWLPVVRGFVRIGGLRVIVVEDSSVDAGTGAGVGGDGPARLPRVLKEWDVVGEVWVS